jgi:hypothetical protein
LAQEGHVGHKWNFINFWSQLMSCQAPLVGCLRPRFRYRKAFVHSQNYNCIVCTSDKSIHLSTLPIPDAASNLVHLSTLPCPSPSLLYNMAMQVAPQPFPAATQPEPDIMDIDIDMDVDLEPLDGDYDLEVLCLSLH